MVNRNRALLGKYRKNSNVGRFSRDEGGVAEVLGDILLVSMSVVLVAVIALQVGNLQQPVESTKIDLVATIDGDDLVIRHMGGEMLEEGFVKIYVGTGSVVMDTFNISDGMNGDKEWSLGDTWSANISSEIAVSESTRSQIFVQVVDIRQDAVILDQILRKGVSTELFPDIGLDMSSFKFSNDNPDNDVYITIEVNVVNYGDVNVTNINVQYFDGKTYIGSNNTIHHLNHTGLPDDNRTVTLRWRTTYIGKHIISIKAIPKLNETNLANNYLSKNLVVGFGVNPEFDKPNLILKHLLFSKETPKSKETVIVTAEIGNTARITATGFQLEWGDDFEGNNVTINVTTYSKNVTYVKGALVKFEWSPQKGGTHKFWANIINVLPDGEDAKADADPDLDRDYLEREIEVLPTILLVDDDRAGRGAARDTITYMREAVSAIGISPDIVVVSGGDGPQFQGTGTTLDDYDVVIWMTGYETMNTLTTSGPTNDVDNLEKYLDQNGSLWLIGQDIVDDLWNNGGVNGQSFLANYLNVSGHTLDQGVTATIRGNDNCPVTSGLAFDTRVPAGLSNTADVIVPNGGISAMDDTADQNLSLLHNQSTRGDSKDHKVAFFAFEFAHIQSPSDRSILTYEIMAWFNATVSMEGDDVAVSEVVISPKNPHYKQEVLITATIRNNGLNDLTGVKVIFKEVFAGIERVIDPVATVDPNRAPDPLTDSPDTNNPMSIDLSGKGGLEVTYKYWTPAKIGLHAIKVIVDPNDVIREFNEENNEFQSILSPTDVFVDAITLVVDDDQATGIAQNTTKDVVDVLEFLNYKYDVYTVDASTSFNGPGTDNLTKYNSIIWVTGDANANTLKDEDMTNLTSYLTNYDDSKLLIIGQNMVDDVNFWGNTSFRQGLLGLDARAASTTPSTIYGILNNNISHGVEYTTTTTFPDGADTIDPFTAAESILVDASGNTYAVAFHNQSGVDYKVMTMSMEFAFLDQDDEKRELMFNILHWFGLVDQRIELRTTWDDMFFGQDNGPTIQFEDQNPVLGSSYILQAKVWNLGGTPGGAVVRFVDGTTVINSVNVYVPASTWDPDGTFIPGTGIAEVIWTPLFAGHRPITVKVDPDQNIPVTSNPRDTTGEVFKFNNNATRTIEVYFFYDDMENGAGSWDHDTTLLSINGEQPIEYFDRLRPIDTNIIDQWEEPLVDWEKDITDGYSLPSSFKVREPLDLNMSPNLRVSVCIDDSGSMRGPGMNYDPNYLRLDAVLNFINSTLEEGDEMAIYRFDTDNGDWGGGANARFDNLYFTDYGGDLWEGAPFENMTTYLNDRTWPNAPWPSGENPETFNNQGGTPLYDCIVSAINDQKANYNPPEFLYPVVIVLTDGMDTWSGNNFRSTYDVISNSGLPLYTIGLGIGHNDDELFVFAEKSNGGKYYFAVNADVLNDTFQRIASNIGSGASRFFMDAQDSGSSRADDEASPEDLEDVSGDGSRALTTLRILNPARAGIGGVPTEKWGVGTSINMTWRCIDGVNQNFCGHATISLSFNNGASWNVIANDVGTRVDNQPGWTYQWYDRNGGNWYNNRIYVYNWTVPDIPGDVLNTVMIRVAETGQNGVTWTMNSRTFSIFDMGITTASASPATERAIVTDPFQLNNYEGATLSIMQRYDLLFGENGGVIQVGSSNNQAGPYVFEYIKPTQSYTGNLRLLANQTTGVVDDLNNDIIWAWNGRSGGGTYQWEHVEVNLDKFIGKWVKVKFSMYTWGFGNGGTWAIDNVKVVAERAETDPIAQSADQWELYEWTSGVDPAQMEPNSGTHMWWNHDPSRNHDFKHGIDNSLYTKSIDLTNAKDAHLSAYFKFNYDDDAGRPPDGFRVELSNDNGVSWYPMNLGVRSSWGMSGDWATDGKSPDGTQAYTGITDDGLDSAAPEWVKAGSLWRLNTNLSGWSGSVIKLRFRVITNLDANHYMNPTTFRGFAIDDVIIHGNTTISSAPWFPHDTGQYTEDMDGCGFGASSSSGNKAGTKIEKDPEAEAKIGVD